MTKLDDVAIKSKDKPLREHISDLVFLWNNGKFDFRITSSVPSDSPTGAEMRLFVSGTTAKLYIYAPTATTPRWYRTADLTAV